MTNEPSATSSSPRKPLHNGLFLFAVVPFMAFHGLVALLSETERHSALSHYIVMLAPHRFGAVMALCILGDIVVLGFLIDRFHHKRTFVDVLLMLLCGVLAGLSLRGLYLACV